MQQTMVIGQPVNRIDAVEKVTGEALYGADVRLSGTLYGAILRSPHTHARIIGINTARAEQLPGVKAVITAKDTLGEPYGQFVADEYVLAIDRVRFAGDEVAAVAAVDQTTAERALELIAVDYELLPAVYDLRAAMEPDAPFIYEGAGKNLAQIYQIIRGDVDQGFAQSCCIIEQEFELPYQNQCCLEPVGCLVSLDSNGRFTAWVPSCSPFMLQKMLAETLGVSPAQVRVIQTAVGGSFGAKKYIKQPIIAAMLSRKTGRPVQVRLNREEEFLSSRSRLATIIKLKMGFAADGKILAKRTEIVADNGAYTDIAPRLLETTARRIDNLYRMENIATYVKLIYTNKTPTGAFRGFGNPQMHFAMESVMDIAAHKLGIDPVKLRVMNVTQAGDVTVHGWEIASCGLPQCISTAVQESGWEQKRSDLARHSGHKRRGLGVACMIHVAGRRTRPQFPGSNAEVRVLEAGKVLIRTGEADVGQGCNSLFAQIAAEVLEVPFERMGIATLDTDFSPFAWGSFSDRVTTIGGNAVRLAALDARRKIIAMAVEFWATSEADVEYKLGHVTHKGTGETLSIFDFIGQYHMDRGGVQVVGEGTYYPNIVFPDPKTKYGNLAAAYTFATQIAEVEVNTKTGGISILNFTCAHDLGRAINPTQARGQVQGALLQGIGYGIYEEMLFDDGQLINGSFLDYKIPTSLDAPPSNVFLIESNDSNGPFGAKGVGEPGLVPTAPAIANAIYNAIGVRFTSLPITPEKVLAALKPRN